MLPTLEQVEDRLSLERALRSLPARQQEVLRLRFGFEGGVETLRAVGVELGVTQERVRQIEARALRNLRKRQAQIDPERAKVASDRRRLEREREERERQAQRAVWEEQHKRREEQAALERGERLARQQAAIQAMTRIVAEEYRKRFEARAGKQFRIMVGGQYLLDGATLTADRLEPPWVFFTFGGKKYQEWADHCVWLAEDASAKSDT